MFEIIPRDHWGAREPYSIRKLKRPLSDIYRVNTHSKTCIKKGDCLEIARLLQIFHMQFQQTPDIRYNFLIASDGNVYEGCGWTQAPYLPSKFAAMRESSLLIAYIGDFPVSELLPDEMLKAEKQLLEYGVENFYITQKYEVHDIRVTFEESPMPKKLPQAPFFERYLRPRGPEGWQYKRYWPKPREGEPH